MMTRANIGKQGLLHEEFVIPADAPEWLQSLIAERSVSGASEAFWNRVEEFEKRSDAQLANDVTIALQMELSAEQDIALVRDFVARHITAHGTVADWVFHDAPGNPHIHLMTTLRPLTEDSFGPKKMAVTGPGSWSIPRSCSHNNLRVGCLNVWSCVRS